MAKAANNKMGGKKSKKVEKATKVIKATKSEPRKEKDEVIKATKSEPRKEKDEQNKEKRRKKLSPSCFDVDSGRKPVIEIVETPATKTKSSDSTSSESVPRRPTLSMVLDLNPNVSSDGISNDDNSEVEQESRNRADSPRNSSVSIGEQHGVKRAAENVPEPQDTNKHVKYDESETANTEPDTNVTVHKRKKLNKPKQAAARKTRNTGGLKKPPPVQRNYRKATKTVRYRK